MSKVSAAKGKQKKTQKQSAGAPVGIDGIQVIPQISSTELKFTIRNERGKESQYPPCFANSLRRTIIADLPTYLISRKQIHFTEATSMIHQDMLTHRLHISPICLDKVIRLEQPASLEFVCDVANPDDEMHDVLLRHFIPKYLDEELNPEDFWTNPDILIAKLRSGQAIRCQGSFHLGTSYTEDSGFQCVAATRYVNGTSEEVLQRNFEAAKAKGLILPGQEELWLVNHREQAVDHNDDGCPMEYQYTMESLGVYQPLDIVPVAAWILENRFTNISQTLEDWLNHYQDMEGRESWKQGNHLDVTWYEAEGVPALDLRFSHENETLSDLLTYWIRRDPRVKFVGFRIPHPLDKLVIIRVSLTNSTRTKEGAHDIIHLVKEHVDKLAKQWADFGAEFSEKASYELSDEMKIWLRESLPKILSL